MVLGRSQENIKAKSSIFVMEFLPRAVFFIESLHLTQPLFFFIIIISIITLIVTQAYNWFVKVEILVIENVKFISISNSTDTMV